MSSLSKQHLLHCVFSDPTNYPYGFSRSGDFSIAESRALGNYGCLIAALVDGKLSPTDEETEHYLQSALGNAEPTSIQERAWLKYQRRINRPRHASIHGSKPNRESSDIEVDEDIDLDLEA